MDSILTSIKKLLHISADDKSFDTDVIIHINTQLNALVQMGVGMKGFNISSDLEKWSDFLLNADNLEAAKTYTYAKTKLVFDPPANAVHVNALKEAADEAACRLNYEAEMEV